MTTATSTPLSLGEGVLLGYALVAAVARKNDVRALAIKGPITEHHDLRPPRPSVDVDFLVDPRDARKLRAALEAAGWIYRVNTSVGVIPQHSFTMHHPTWPCELDLHEYFPGFLADPQVVFDQLWAVSDLVEVAGTRVAAAGKLPMVLVAALHLLRDEETNAEEFSALCTRVAPLLSDEERTDLAQLATQTGSSETLASLFDALGVPVRPSRASRKALRLWRTRSHVLDRPSVGWTHSFLTTPVWRWPSLLRRALLLTEGEIRDAYPDLRPGWVGLWTGRGRRWWRGTTALPRALWYVVGAQRQARRDERELRPR